MLRSYLLIAGVTATGIGLSLASGCGSDATPGTGGTGGGASTGGSGPGVHAEPPGPGPSKPGDGMGSTTFAISKLYLGDTKRDGTPDHVNGWKEFGYDLDGKISTPASTDLCKPRDNASPQNVYPDGKDGIDNSFGKNILQIILGIAADAPTKINESLLNGSFTIMLDLEKLGSSADYNPLLTRLYGGKALDNPPKFDGTDVWPVIPELLTCFMPGMVSCDGPDDIKSAKVQFPMSYLVGNTWVSGSKGDVALTLAVQGFSLQLTISSALISMELSSDHKTAVKGTIAGVLATDSLIEELKKVAGAFDPSLCIGPTIESITTQIAQASDIMKNGTQDPSKQCDGISIGLGFDATNVILGPIGMPSPGMANPCADAGTGP